MSMYKGKKEKKDNVKEGTWGRGGGKTDGWVITAIDVTVRC